MSKCEIGAANASSKAYTGGLEDDHSLGFGDMKISSSQSGLNSTGAKEDHENAGLKDSIPLPTCSPESIAKLYPHLYSTILQGQTSLLRKNANQSLAALFPSVLTAEGPKCKNESSASIHGSILNPAVAFEHNDSPSSVTGSVAAELSQALSTALSLSVSESAKAGTVTSYKDSVPPSDTKVTQMNAASDIGTLSQHAKSEISINSSGNQEISIASSLPCGSATKKKNQLPRSRPCTNKMQSHSANGTSPLHSSSESTTSFSSANENVRPEIGPATLGDALQQKIRETQAKIKSNVVLSSNSQSLLPPGKCNSHLNHQRTN